MKSKNSRQRAEPIQVMPIADGSGFVKIHDDGIEIERHDPPPPPEPMRYETEKMKTKRELEMEGGAAAIKRHEERVRLAKEFNANRVKTEKELESERKEAAAQGFNRPLELNPGNLPIGRHTTEGDIMKSPHQSKLSKG